MSIKQAKENEISEKCVRTTEILKDVIIEKEMDKKSWCMWKTIKI